MEKKILEYLYLINKIAKKIRDEIVEYESYNDELDDKDKKNIEYLKNLKDNVYYLKENVLEKIKNKATKIEKHIVRKQEDYYGEYDYYFVVFSTCYYFDIDGKLFSFHSDLEKEYYLNEEDLIGYKQIEKISSEINLDINKINIKYILKLFEKKGLIDKAAMIEEIDYLTGYNNYQVLNNYIKGGKSMLFDW